MSPYCLCPLVRSYALLLYDVLRSTSSLNEDLLEEVETKVSALYEIESTRPFRAVEQQTRRRVLFCLSMAANRDFLALGEEELRQEEILRIDRVLREASELLEMDRVVRAMSQSDLGSAQVGSLEDTRVSKVFGAVRGLLDRAARYEKEPLLAAEIGKDFFALAELCVGRDKEVELLQQLIDAGNGS